VSGPQRPMNATERMLLEHRAAVRVNLPGQLAHAAQTVAASIGAAVYASVAVPAEVRRAAETLTGWASRTAALVDREEAERERAGADRATWQRQIERQFPAKGSERAQEPRTGKPEGQDMPEGGSGPGEGPPR
jgi:hypothetical protein